MAKNTALKKIDKKTRSHISFQEDCYPINDKVTELIEKGDSISYFSEYREKLIQRIKRNYFKNRNNSIRGGLVSGGIFVFFLLMNTSLSLDFLALCFDVCFALLFLSIFISEVIKLATCVVTLRALTQSADYGHLHVRQYRITEKMIYNDLFYDTFAPDFFLSANELIIKVPEDLFENAIIGGTLTAAVLHVDENDSKYSRFFCVIEIIPPENEPPEEKSNTKHQDSQILKE